MMAASPTTNPRQLAFLALRSVHKGAFADVAVEQVLSQHQPDLRDRRLFTELVYGTIRRQRTLDALIDQFAQKPAQAQPPDLRLILHLGLYQLRYLNQVPAAAAVDTTVELAKQNRLGGLAGFVNGLLRKYQRSALQSERDPLDLPADPIGRLGQLHSFPDWIVQVWVEQFGLAETEQLCQWMNQPPQIDLRINPLRTNLETVETRLKTAAIAVSRVPGLPQALRLPPSSGAIQQLPGYDEGWWMVQDSSAQLVGYLVDPQPGETIADACAAPGGKTLHLAELMGDCGQIIACDRTASRLKKLQQNCDRLGCQSIQIQIGDSCQQPQWQNRYDRVLLDVPCSGLGTLHRHADARWRQTPDTVSELTQLQTQLLRSAAAWVKPQGVLVYTTCTLHPAENEAIIHGFLGDHPQWQIDRANLSAVVMPFISPEGWVKILPYCHNMDGFFMVRLKRTA